jgi:hypothetical protein
VFGTACRPCIQVSILCHKRTSQFNIADSFEGTVSQIRDDVTRSGLSDEIRSSHSFGTRPGQTRLGLELTWRTTWISRIILKSSGPGLSDALKSRFTRRNGSASHVRASFVGPPITLVHRVLTSGVHTSFHARQRWFLHRNYASVRSSGLKARTIGSSGRSTVLARAE